MSSAEYSSTKGTGNVSSWGEGWLTDVRACSVLKISDESLFCRCVSSPPINNLPLLPPIRTDSQNFSAGFRSEQKQRVQLSVDHQAKKCHGDLSLNYEMT
ncbi:hypothetical protein TNCV_4564651 [Trichonephila clavipes]|nr:hypothetical protein TNCV_4564651 [Trichonephila clavipes]